MNTNNSIISKTDFLFVEVAIGAPYNHGGGADSGHVRVFRKRRKTTLYYFIVKASLYWKVDQEFRWFWVFFFQKLIDEQDYLLTFSCPNDSSELSIRILVWHSFQKNLPDSRVSRYKFLKFLISAQEKRKRKVFSSSILYDVVPS